MKHIIIEGLDALGKDTLIKGICDSFNYENIAIRHFAKPPKNNIDPLSFQINVFLKEFNLLHSFSSCNDYHKNLIIWNRSHLGEYVWGSLYRGCNKHVISDKLKSIEEKYLIDETYLIYLYSDADFAAKNEDGESLGKSISDKEHQLKLFGEIYDSSLIKNKIKIKVNCGTDPKNINDWVDRKYILKSTLNFIK